MSWQSPMIALLVASLARPFVLVAGAWLLIRAFNLRHPSSRHAVWTAVLVGMLLLPAVSMLTPHWALPLPRRASAAAVGPTGGVMSSAFSWLSSPPEDGLPSAVPPPAAKPAPSLNLATAATVILSCYFVGLLVMLAYWTVGWVFLRQLLARSKRLRARWLRESADVSSPVTAGVLRPIVILPAGWRAWDAKVREAVLTHEFAHIRRHDPLARALGRLAQWIFWFHPLAWWLARKTTNLAELACDAAVLERTSDPAGYSRALVDFAASVQDAGRRAALPGLAMARPGSELGRRIDQIFELSRNPLRNHRRPGLLLVLLGVPLLCLTATAGLAHSAPAAAPPVQARQFDAMSIKQAPRPLLSEDQRAAINPIDLPGVHFDPKQLHAWATPLTLVTAAFKLKPFQVAGLPPWALTQWYEIRASANAPASPNEMWAMLRGVLETRFGLRSHWENRDIDVLLLAVSPGGPKFAPLRGKPRPPAGAEVDVKSVGELVDFLNSLTAMLGKPTVDGTKLTGTYDIRFKVGDEAAGCNGCGYLDPDTANIAGEIKHQLGLELVPRKLPFPVLVVDSLSKPAGN